MSELRLKEYLSLEACTMDLLMLDTGLLDETQELATAARVALGTDALASAGEVLPDLDSTDRRGWWGDLDAQEIWDGWPIGCKNWLLLRSKITDATSVEGATLQRAQFYTQAALQPFIDKRIATQMDVKATRTELQRIDVLAQIYRGPNDEIDLRYQILWQDDVVPEPLSLALNMWGLQVANASPVLGTPVFNTKSPVHLPPKSMAVSSPVVGPATLAYHP